MASYRRLPARLSMLVMSWRTTWWTPPAVRLWQIIEATSLKCRRIICRARRALGLTMGIVERPSSCHGRTGWPLGTEAIFTSERAWLGTAVTGFLDAMAPWEDASTSFGQGCWERYVNVQRVAYYRTGNRIAIFRMPEFRNRFGCTRFAP